MADVAEVVADERKVRLPDVDFLVVADFLHCFGVEDVAPKAVDSVGGVDDESSVAKKLHHFVDFALIGVFRINSDEHNDVSLCAEFASGRIRGAKLVKNWGKVTTLQKVPGALEWI